MLEERFLIDPLWRVGLLIGFLGGFTTFSSYGLQTFSLLKQGEVFSATANVLASNLAGLALVWLGYSGARLTLEKSIW
jgi:fluoride exporter